MVSGVFLIKDGGQLIEMQEEEYTSENLLQKFLADYPSLIPGDQIDDRSPRRWLLISREAALPSEENGADRWSVDHLFLDQDAIPTLVEVKELRYSHQARGCRPNARLCSQCRGLLAG